MAIESAFTRKAMKLMTAVATAGVLAGCATLPVVNNTSQGEVVWLDQGWPDYMREEFHAMSQGTATIPVPYDWFLALERPILTLFGKPPLMRDDEYLSQIGFILNQPSKYNPDGLPVGFARDTVESDPVTGEPADLIGFTCSACHSGQFNYNGQAFGVDGAPATTDLDILTLDIAKSIFMTLNVPGRFDRFANRVLGGDASQADRDALKAAFKARCRCSSTARRSPLPVIRT